MVARLSSKLFMRLSKVNWRVVVLCGLFVVVFFCLGGGFNVLDGFLSGFGSVGDARFGVSAVFFVGFLFAGLFGLGYALKKRLVPVQCLLGLGVVGFSYFGIEVLLEAVRG
jgi:hypothetical protein